MLFLQNLRRALWIFHGLQSRHGQRASLVSHYPAPPGAMGMPQALGLPATQDGRGAPSTRSTWRARPWTHRPARRARGWHGSRHTSGADRLGTTTTVEPPAGGHDASVPRTGVVRHALRRQPSHAPAALAPHLFKLAKVE